MKHSGLNILKKESVNKHWKQNNLQKQIKKRWRSESVKYISTKVERKKRKALKKIILQKQVTPCDPLVYLT